MVKSCLFNAVTFLWAATTMSQLDESGCFPQLVFFLFLGLVSYSLVTGDRVLWPIAGVAILSAISVMGHRR
jgi:hypothetical protein